MLDGCPCPVDPRHVLAQADARLRKLGYTAKVALEYEFGIFHADHALMQKGRYRELQPWGHSLVNYDLVRSGDYQDLVSEFMRRMESLGIGVASFVTEYGYGMYEFALTPKPAVEAADDAMRAKLHLRELCAERGLVATFMTRFQPPGKESACGAHHHISLWHGDVPVLAAGVNALSPVGQQFLAGLLHRMRETHVMFRPTINSYRRFDRGAWSPQDVSWGYENRTAAIRTITTPSASASACRFEHRVPGADVNPYLTLAAMLAAGAEGIEKALIPPAAQPGAAIGPGAVPLQSTRAAAVEDFAASDFCAEAFGTWAAAITPTAAATRSPPSTPGPRSTSPNLNGNATSSDPLWPPARQRVPGCASRLRVGQRIKHGPLHGVGHEQARGARAKADITMFHFAIEQQAVAGVQHQRFVMAGVQLQRARQNLHEFLAGM